jgi:thiamine-monophosphate kinase
MKTQSNLRCCSDVKGAIISIMKVSELGEFGLVDLLAKMVYSSRDNKVPSWRHLQIGIGDDAAVWHNDASIQLATVDSLVQDIHFTLDTTSWDDLGWKALAINLSDIAAMGGLPRYALIALALPSQTEVEDVAALYRGMLELAQQFGVAIIGGDTDSAPIISVSVTVLGSTQAKNKTVLTRSTAKPGEMVAVTGCLGAATAGLKMLIQKLQFDAEATANLKQAFLRPNPRINEGGLLLKHGIKTAIDISDGLISDLNHICKASQVGAQIEIDRIPIHPAVKANFGDRALELAVSGGEDYELLFTGNAEAIDKIRKTASCPITVIGQIVASKADAKESVELVDNKGNIITPSKTGWEHFTTK